MNQDNNNYDYSNFKKSCNKTTLIEFEKERRRIIQNQTVKRKTIEKWINDNETVDINDEEDESDFEFKFIDNFNRFKNLESTQNPIDMIEFGRQNLISNENMMDVSKSKNNVNKLETIDTSSIIENKSSTKKYWEEKMIAEQELIKFESIPNEGIQNCKIKTSTANQINLNHNHNQKCKLDKTFNGNGANGKLGSDGESEGSLESSLSPLDVDSLEGSEGRQSPEGEAASEQSEHHDSIVNIPRIEPVSINNNLLKNDFNKNVCLDFDCNDRNELSTVIEEEQEHDSLEEFIKHESECMQHEKTYLGNEIKVQDDKEVLYEEIADIKSGSEENIINVTDTNGLIVGDLVVVDESFENYEIADDLSGNSIVEKSSKNHDLNCEDLTQPKPQIIGETYQINQTEHNSEPAKVVITKKPRIRSANPAESKIASEIREFKQREEELRKLREEQLLKKSVQQTGNNSENDENVCELNKNDPNSNQTKSKSISDNKMGSSELIMKALADATFENNLQNKANRSQMSFNTQNQIESNEESSIDNQRNANQINKTKAESPIEREIRIAKEREEELRREKMKLYNQIENKVSTESSVNLTASTSNKVSLLSQNNITLINAVDTQKFLATTRIQQEIEEQTQREIALREIGSIQTLSQERTDAVKVNKFVEMDKNNFDRANSYTESITPIESPIDMNYCSSPRFDSSSSSTSSINNPSTQTRKLSSSSIVSPSKGTISMHKFISSKGKSAAKETSFSPFNLSNGRLTNNYIGKTNDYQELKPPQFAKSNLRALRRHVSAECKIKEELKEMKNREDELRKERIRTLGLSQPNLNTLINEDENIEEETSSYENKNKLFKMNSNPNLSQNCKSNDDICKIGGPRRRIALIAQWEQKIQKVQEKD